MSKLTITEVARMAGVSIGTVSRVLNNRPGVNPDTRTQVLEVVSRLGYVPDAGARKLARGSRGLIGVAPFSAHSSNSPYYGILLDAIQETIVREGYAARVLEPSVGEEMLSEVSGFIVPGVHLDDSRLSLLIERNIPLVVVGRCEKNVPWVDIDNTGGMRLALQHLIKLGHSRILHMTGTPIGQTTYDRLESYHQTMQDAGFTLSDELILDGTFTELGAYRILRQALEKGLEFTAVAAASDEMAYGAILALQDAGFRVPYDVSVTGYDDLPFAPQTQPSLTTVRQPIRQLGRTAAQLMLELIAGNAVRQVVLPTELVVRSSSAPLSRNRR